MTFVQKNCTYMKLTSALGSLGNLSFRAHARMKKTKTFFGKEKSDLLNRQY